MRLAAGLCPASLGELERSHRLPSCNYQGRVPTFKGKGQKGRGMEKKVREGEGRKGKVQELPPRYLTSG